MASSSETPNPATPPSSDERLSQPAAAEPGRTEHLETGGTRLQSTVSDNPATNQWSGRPPLEEGTKRRELTPARATLLAAYVAAGATLVAALIGIAATFLSNDEPPTSRMPTAAPAPPGLAAPPKAVFAKVINTGGIGVFKYEQPTNQSGKQFGPGEGELVEVLCQVRDGQSLTDPAPAPGQPNDWPVWNKMKDGFFIPDLYTDLPKDRGLTPPYGLSIC